MNAGRNEQCPCGSGKKYKKCHLIIQELEKKAAEAEAYRLWRIERDKRWKNGKAREIASLFWLSGRYL